MTQMQFENVTCPHCGILCDDISIEVNGYTVKPITPLPDHCNKAYENASISNGNIPTPMVNGKPATFDEAIKKASELLSSASQPLVSGLIADVQSCREAVALTDKIHGVIDHANGTNMRPNIAVMQRHGKVKTTLAEARNRADNIIIFGSEILNRFPRFLDRILSPKETLGNNSAVNKTITIIDSQAEAQAHPFTQNNIHYLRIDAPSLDTIIQHLQRVVHTHPEQSDEHDSATQALINLYQTILDSKYTAIVWNTSLLNQKTAEHTIQSLTTTMKSIMKTHRCVGLPLGGSKGEITANQVTTWQTGVPLPVSFATGVPVHEPFLNNGAKMLRNNETDCLLWISTYSPDDIPPETDTPTIVIGHPKMSHNKNIKVFIPVGVPGIDTRGLACRTDSVATLPLQKIRSIELPAAQEVLLKITGML